jgi:hypothetical protein
MKPALSAFEIAVSDLRAHMSVMLAALKLSRVGALESASSGTNHLLRDLHVAAQNTGGLARLNYNAVIISLYGSLEQFLEGLLSGYVRAAHRAVPSYDELPRELRKHHSPLTMELMQRLNDPRYVGLTTERELIARLHSCFSTPHKYELNDLAFTQHKANFRTEVIGGCLARLGLQLSRVEGDMEYRGICIQNFPNQRDPGFVIDDLADRRNEVAHGSPAILLSTELLGAYINVVEAYAYAIYRVAVSAALEQAVKHHGTCLGHPKEVYGNRVLGITIRGQRISLGDLIVSQVGDTYRCGHVRSLEVDGVRHKKIEARSSVDVGMVIGIRPKMNHLYHRLPGEFRSLSE